MAYLVAVHFPATPGLHTFTEKNLHYHHEVAHIQNAHKGDIILSAGCTMIGGLLREVAPPQYHSHTGIMTANYYELRHSTATIERYRDYPEGDAGTGHPLDGFREDVVRYSWPGTITQSIDEAFNGETRFDPETGKEHVIAGFSANRIRCGDDPKITYPLVVKPPPGHDPAIRETLRAVAEAAKNIHGHYRFFGYTNGAISEDRAFEAPVDAGWAHGTIATVCTTFIWTALRSLGIELEGETLEFADFLLGAERDADTLDGLYLYTEAERQKAGKWLYNHIYNLAVEEGGFLGTITEPFTDARDDIATQFTNCFANDSCDPQSNNWENPGVGRAVSPDNILHFWDSPETGGVYGYNEEMVYRQGGRRAITVWQPSGDLGTLKGTVLLNGSPVENASVTILDLVLFTDANGQFQDDLIPAGTYFVEASKMVDGRFYYTQQIVTVQANQTTNITLNLEPPPDSLRQITVQGEMKVHDAELIGGGTKTFNVFSTRFLSPSSPTQTVEFRGCNDNEVGGIIELNLSLLPDNSVSITAVTKLYDDDGPFGFSCYESDDLVATSTNSFVVPPGLSSISIPRLEDDGDWVEASFGIANEQQP